MKKTRIMHLLLSMNIGGAERVAASIVAGSDSERFEHEVCALDEIGPFGLELERRGVRTTLLRRKSVGIDWLLIPRLTFLMRRRRIDLIHTHGETPWFYGSLACALSFGATRCLTTVHGYGGGDRTSLKGYRLWKVLTMLSSRVVLVAENLRRELVEQRLPSAKLLTILNGIEVERIAACKGEARSSWGIEEGEVVIGIVARLSAVKNHSLLIRAVAELAKRGVKARLAVVGDGPERAPLQSLAEELGLGRQVVFCGAQPSCLGFFRMFDIFVLPSLSEGISMTVLEAQASKVPVVASRVGGNVEIIEDGRTGILFESGDLVHLVAVLGQLIGDRARRERLAEAGFLSVRARFSFCGMIASYHRLYGETAPAGGLS